MASKLSVFLAELKRRKVYRVAVVYVVVGAGIIGLCEAALPSSIWEGIQIPVGVMILVGLPIALVLTWAYELKPDESRPVESPEDETPPAAVATAPPEVTDKEQRKSIVVLPFDNMSPDPSDAYFSDGLTEELIAELSCVGALRVISRTTAMKLKGSDKDIATIGRELDVQHVLEGSVRKAGNDLRITAQLIDARTDEHLWAERYSGTMDDVFEIQERLSRKIVNQLKVSLSPEEDDSLAKPRISHPLAFQCYMRARQQLTAYTPESNDRAISLLEKGLEIEGPNELLFTTLGIAHTRYSFGSQSEEVIQEKAERWASKAFEVNPNSTGAHVLQGVILFYQGRTQEAVEQLKTVLRADPDNSDALSYLGFITGAAGHLDASSAYFQRLTAVDPMAGGVNAEWCSFYSGEFEEAVKGYRVEWETDSQSPYARWAYGVCLAWAGQVEKGCEILGQIVEDSPGTSFGLFAQFIVPALQGDRDRAIAAMTPDLETLAKRDIQFSWIMGSGYAMLGMVAEAVAWLRQAMGRGFINYPFLAKQEPFLARIRSEPQLQEVLKEVKQRWEAFVP